MSILTRDYSIEFLLGIAIAKRLQNMPDKIGGAGKFLTTVTQGLVKPSELPVTKWKAACVGSMSGTFEPDITGRLITKTNSNMFIFVYLREQNPALASLYMSRFVQLVIDELSGCDWRGEIPDISNPALWTNGIPPNLSPVAYWYDSDFSGIHLVVADYDYGDVFHTLGIDGAEYDLKPPNYGIRVGLSVKIGTGNL